MHHEVILSGSYNYGLVALSVLIAIIACYAALDLGGRVTASAGTRRFFWLLGGASSMGMGIWSMHYIGMLAYSLPIPVLYDWPMVLYSLVAAVFASAVALFIVSRKKMGLPSIGVGGVVMGAAIASMHYVGMDAMRLQAMCQYNAGLFSLSILLAVVISMVALWFTFHLRSEKTSVVRRKLASALLMGVAIPVMHYTGMAAVSFTPMDSPVDYSHSVEISSLGIFGIGVVSVMVLGLAILTSFVDRRFDAHSLELQASEIRYRQLVESARVVLWRSDELANQFSYVNHEAEELFGYRCQYWTNTPGFWIAQLHPDDRAAVKAQCAATVIEGEARNFEHRMLTADGRTLWMRTSVRALSKDGNKELVGVMTDITERKAAQEIAEEASRMKGKFLAEIERLNTQLKSENSRMSAELDITHRLREMMLPREDELDQIAELDISGYMHAATEVGGDYYDVVPNEFGVVFGIGDVTGHGLESGVIAIMVQTAVRTLLASGEYDSRKFFEVLNRVVYDSARRMNCDRNLTLSLLHYKDKQVTISGQHEEVLVVRSNGELERHDTLHLGFPLGLDQDISRHIGEAKIPLKEGDVMVIYTDGITEAINNAGVTYGIERLSEAITSNHVKPSGEIRAAVLNSLKEHVGTQPALDDMSLLIVKPVVSAESPNKMTYNKVTSTARRNETAVATLEVAPESGAEANEIGSLQRELKQHRSEIRDLQIALSSSAEHGDLLQEHFRRLSEGLKAEVAERQQTEERLKRILDTLTREKGDLEILVQILIDQGDISAEEGQEARTDVLTRIANRRGFDEHLAKEWQRHIRAQRPLSLLLCDVDYFKLYNDQYGHQAGDECLRKVANSLSQGFRAGDLVARYGGEEFVMVLPDTDRATAFLVAERVRASVQAAAIPHGHSPISDYVTVSIGISSQTPKRDGDTGALIREADRNLYHAKELGRNRVSNFSAGKDQGTL